MPVIQLELDSKGAISSLQKFDKAVDVTEKKSVSAFGKMSGAVGMISGLIGTVMGAAVTSLAVASVDAAAKMEEAQNKYDVVFRGMTKTTDEWVSTLEDSYAMSELSAKQYLSDTKAIVDGTNMQSGAAAKLSFEVVKLSRDLASFHDKQPEQAVRAMTSALTGEYEAMKQFGVVMKKTEVIQEAMLQNNLDNKDAVTQAMMAEAAYTLILKKSGEAQGDTARSAGTYTQELMKATEQITNLKVAIGQQLLPLLTPLITAFNEWITVTGRIESIIAGLITGVQFLHNGFNGIVLVAKGVIAAFGFILKAVVSLAKPLSLVLDAMIKFNLIDVNPIRELESAVNDFKDASVEAFEAQLDKIVETNNNYEALKTTVVNGAKEQAAAQDKVTESIAKTAEELIKEKEVFDNTIPAMTQGLEEVNGVWVQVQGTIAAVKDDTKELAGSIKDELTPAEKQLAEEVLKVDENAQKSTASLMAQADAANKVADAVGNVADANQRTSATADGTYVASAAWSGGKKSMGSAPAMSQAEEDYYNSVVTQGSGDHYWDSGKTMGPMGYDKNANIHSNLDTLLMQQKSAMATIYRAREANDGKPVGSIYNIFNSSISRSDVVSITSEQQRQAVRT